MLISEKYQHQIERANFYHLLLEDVKSLSSVKRSSSKIVAIVSEGKLLPNEIASGHCLNFYYLFIDPFFL